MNLVTLENISKQYSERLLLDQVSLQINSGDKIGLIGINGSGKTTLLRLIAQTEYPDDGQLTVWGGVRVRYLPQEPELNQKHTVLEALFTSDLPEVQLLRRYEWASQQLQHEPDNTEWQDQLTALSDEMDRLNGWAIEAKVKAMLTKLGITDFRVPVAQLSGGQRKRVALARVLIDRADLLILDEPTNHVDAETIAWLEGYLTDEPGALMMVTHDRYFLDRVANRIIDLDRRQLVSYVGNYSHYLERSAARHDQLRVAEENRERLLKRELEWLRRGAQARSTKQKARKQRIEEMQRLSYDSKTNQVALNLATRRLGKQVLEVKQLSKQFDGQPALFKQADFYLKPGDRIGIVGPNGTGKSTFLNLLAERLQPDEGSISWGETVRLGYYDQQSSQLVDDMTVIKFIEQSAPVILAKDGTRMTAFQMLEWFLFGRKKQYAQIGTLSGGERRRLYLLHVLIHQPNVLFLDEPTNDLDIQTLNVLEEFLDHFTGCLVVVSHDRYFLDRAVDYLISFEGGSISQRYPTPYSTYQRLRAEKQSGQTAPTPRPTKSKPKPTQAKPRKLTWKETRELEQLDERLETLEADKERLQTSINQAGADYQQLQQLAEQLQTVETELDTVMERWLELSEIAENNG
ncbi:ABC-F family ATP-binding cassette domain-containing protein [Anaerolineales bacterium HSG6]|nr:ABC-F family ATP-binding cassette domain-containing protein [Anaerolineales bacterium HSG6]